MCKSKIFTELLIVVSDVTEIKQDIIISPVRREEVVDARSLFIYILSDYYGFKPNSIADFLGCTPMNVHKHLNSFKNRLKNNQMLEIYYKLIINKVQTNNRLTIN